MADMVQRTHGRPAESPARRVTISVELPRLGVNFANDQRQELEENANALCQVLKESADKWLNDNIGEDYAVKGYKVEGQVVH